MLSEKMSLSRLELDILDAEPMELRVLGMAAFLFSCLACRTWTAGIGKGGV